MEHIQIRENIFETNSSSSHSFTISNKGSFLYDSLPLDKDGNLVLTGGEFGWEWEKYEDPLIKANYCAVYVLAKENDAYKNMLIEVLLENTKAKKVIFKVNLSDYNSDNYSYIDHQSLDDPEMETIFITKESLRDFIFNDSSILYTGNDNEYAPDMFYDEGGVKYFSVISIDMDGYKDEIHFKDEPNKAELVHAIQRILCYNNGDIVFYKDRNGEIHIDPEFSKKEEDGYRYIAYELGEREDGIRRYAMTKPYLYAIGDGIHRDKINLETMEVEIPRLLPHCEDDFNDTIKIKLNYDEIV